MKTTTRSPRAEHAINVGIASIAIFLAILAVLLWRLETGIDPAIGTATAQAAQPPVVRRKLIVKRKVIRVTIESPAITASATASGSAPAVGGGTSSGSVSAPAPSTSAPAAPAPAPVQSAPAPAPSTSAS